LEGGGGHASKKERKQNGKFTFHELGGKFKEPVSSCLRGGVTTESREVFERKRGTFYIMCRGVVTKSPEKRDTRIKGGRGGRKKRDHSCSNVIPNMNHR